MAKAVTSETQQTKEEHDQDEVHKQQEAKYERLSKGKHDPANVKPQRTTHKMMLN